MSEEEGVPTGVGESETAISVNSAEGFADKLRQQGFLDSEQLFGKDFRERAITNNPVEIIEKTAVIKVEKIIPLSDVEASIGQDEKQIAQLLSTVGDVQVIEGKDKNGNPERLLYSSRQIKNFEGRNAFWLHEVVDPNAKTSIVMTDEDSGKTIIGYEAQRVFVSGSAVMGTTNGPTSTFIDLQDLPQGDAENSVIPIFVGMVKDGKIVQSRGVDNAAYRKGEYIGVQVITDLEGVVSFGHELGHLSYSRAVPDWDLHMQEAREVFKSDSPKSKTTPETARELISFNERAAWDGEKKILGVMQQQPGYEIGLVDMVLTNAQNEESSLLSYDMHPHAGDDPNPEAFSIVMRKLRDVVKASETDSNYSTETGEKISHCPILQLAQEGVDIKPLLKESGVVSERLLKNAE